MHLFILLIALFYFKLNAQPIKNETLFSFTDKHSYTDNRKGIKKDKTYSASKGCCDNSKPYVVLEGYEGPSSFTQFAIWCDHCGVQKFSSEQTELCKSEFLKLYEHLFTEKLNSDLALKLELPESKASLVISKKNSDKKIRVSGGALKCDTKGGLRYRIDLFVR